MNLSRFIVWLTLPLVAVGAAFAYTMPGYAPYDGLISIDRGGLPLVPETLHVNVGAGYWGADKGFNKDGDSKDIQTNPNFLAVPLDVGYAFDENYLADITLQILRPSYTYTDPITTEESTYNAMGLGDLWIKARGIWETGPDFWVGPRLAVKIPVGKVEFMDEKPELGDNQTDIDVGVVAGKYGGETMFKFSGQLGFRYRLEGKAYDETAAAEVDYTPGLMIYTQLEPGIGTGSDQAFQVYVPIGYETSMTAKSDGNDVADSETSSMYLGLYPKYELDERNAIGLKFLYPVFGTMTPQGMYFTLTYDAFIKL
ncbi:MAG: hypothetical protein JSU81_10420 [Candidatus Coatesbacteria bacterium]|nr:MAG: hypothetical protein JSU81_10420 [Candidatus Coatesbacteria bacterium]